MKSGSGYVVRRAVLPHLPRHRSADRHRAQWCARLCLAKVEAQGGANNKRELLIYVALSALRLDMAPRSARLKARDPIIAGSWSAPHSNRGATRLLPKKTVPPFGQQLLPRRRVGSPLDAAVWLPDFSRRELR